MVEKTDEKAVVLSLDSDFSEYEQEQVSAYIENEIEPALADQWEWLTDNWDPDFPSNPSDELQRWRGDLIEEFRISLRMQYLAELRESFVAEQGPTKGLPQGKKRLRLKSTERKRKRAIRHPKEAGETIKRLEWKMAGLEAVCERQREFCPHCGEEKEMICPHCR
jgi:hypothetical protein